MIKRIFDTKLHTMVAWALINTLKRHFDKLATSGSTQSSDLNDSETHRLKRLLTHIKITSCNDDELRILLDLLSNHMDYAACMRSCDLSFQPLTRLPNTVSCWTNMERLSFQGCHLTSLPETVGAWTKMQKLDLTSNKLTSLPRGVGEWAQIEELRLSFNGISELPDAVAGWVQIKALFLVCNRLKTLPNAVTNWTQIRVAGFCGNQLTSIPAGLSAWVNLDKLFLQENFLTPDVNTLAVLGQLQIVHRNSNNPRTQVICLRDNPVANPPYLLNHILPIPLDNFSKAHVGPQQTPKPANLLLEQWQNVQRLFLLLIWTAARHRECNTTQALWLLEPIGVRIVAMAVFGNLDDATVSEVERFVVRNITPTKLSLSANIMDVRTYRIQPTSHIQTTGFCMELFTQPTPARHFARLAAQAKSPQRESSLYSWY